MKALLVTGIAALGLACANAAAGQDLSPTVNRLATAWARGDYQELGGRTARSGLSIALNGDRTGPYTERQAVSALRRLFEDHHTLSARPGKDGITEGKPRRAFIEINWTTRAPGSRAEVHTKVVLALVEEGNDWRINEIRLMK